MNKMEKFKIGLNVLTTIGCFKIVNDMVSSIVVPKSRLSSFAVFFGQTAISVAVSAVANERLEKKIDDTVEWLSE